jgi:hypothetical protein
MMEVLKLRVSAHCASARVLGIHSPVGRRGREFTGCAVRAPGPTTAAVSKLFKAGSKSNSVGFNNR